MGTQEQGEGEGEEEVVAPEDPDDLAAETRDLPQPGVLAILRISRPEWHWLLAGVLLMFVSLTCDLAKVLVYTSAIDKVTVSKNAVGDDESEDHALLPGFPLLPCSEIYHSQRSWRCTQSWKCCSTSSGRLHPSSMNLRRAVSYCCLSGSLTCSNIH